MTVYTFKIVGVENKYEFLEELTSKYFKTERIIIDGCFKYLEIIDFKDLYKLLKEVKEKNITEKSDIVPIYTKDVIKFKCYSNGRLRKMIEYGVRDYIGEVTTVKLINYDLHTFECCNNFKYLKKNKYLYLGHHYNIQSNMNGFHMMLKKKQITPGYYEYHGKRRLIKQYVTKVVTFKVIGFEDPERLIEELIDMSGNRKFTLTNNGLILTRLNYHLNNIIPKYKFIENLASVNVYYGDELHKGYDFEMIDNKPERVSIFTFRNLQLSKVDGFEIVRSNFKISTEYTTLFVFRGNHKDIVTQIENNPHRLNNINKKDDSFYIYKQKRYLIKQRSMSVRSNKE